MNSITTTARPQARLRALLLSVALLAIASGAAACSQGQAGSNAAHSAQPTMETMDGAMAAMWEGRPAYTHATPATEEAYRYALQHQLVLQWIPCFCGCGAMGHGSNLDCYFERQAGGTIVFEEHASFCEICVDITLRTKQLAASGSTLASIRAAIDAEFGSVGPGTDTARPI